MKLLSDDDLDLAAMSDEELAAAWDLWFDLAQATNEEDPPWTHGVFVGLAQLPTTKGDAMPAKTTTRHPVTGRGTAPSG